ncbi:hypothetical protein CR513_28702, partial [Mucuna pruriens]
MERDEGLKTQNNSFSNFKHIMCCKCTWANTTRPRGFRKDSWQFTLVNFSHCIHTGEHEDDDPYIEVSQAQMVYYVDDEVNKGWSIVVHMMPRDLYDMGEVEEDITFESEPYHEQDLSNLFTNETEIITLTRNDVNDEFVTINHVENQLQGDANITTYSSYGSYSIATYSSYGSYSTIRYSSHGFYSMTTHEQGNTKKIQLTKSGIFEMPRGECENISPLRGAWLTDHLKCNARCLWSKLARDLTWYPKRRLGGQSGEFSQ